MLDTSKVIWKEGMFLQPHHFQQNERFLLDSLQMRFKAQNTYCAGFTEIVVDPDAIGSNLISITRARGVLPDGVAFDVPLKGPLPIPRSFVDHFTPERQSLDVFMALPYVIEGKPDVASVQSEGQNTRFSGKEISVTDEVFGVQKKNVEIGSYNFRILFSDETIDDHASLPICRLVRNASGQIALDEKFIPPLLYCCASPFIGAQLRSMLEILLAKITNLSASRKQVDGGFAEFSGAEETAFRLLYTLNTYTPLINHHHLANETHPFELFTLLTQFLGALCTFSSSISIRNLPRYDHASFGAVLDRFMQLLRTILNAEISAGSVIMPLEQVRPSTYVARCPDPRLFTSNARFYFAISATAPEKELIVGVVSRVKSCSPDKLDMLIASAMPGVQLMHTSRPPEALSTKPGYHYFSFDQQSDLWKGVALSASIAIYFPNNYSDLKLEIVALKA